MAKDTSVRQTKFELRREDNACTQIFKWDLDKHKYGPISVETIWKQWILDDWDNKRVTNKEDDDE